MPARELHREEQTVRPDRPQTPSRGRPRLAFFQWNHRPNAGASRYLLLHMQHHVRCLAESFDVTVVSEDCDYDEVCDRIEPDLALFEAGYRTHGSRRIAISNTAAHPDVPKLGLHNGDPWCDRRAGFLSDMDLWGIEDFFTIGTCMPDYTPAVADRTFVWPNFIDPEMFRDYGLPKVVPVMLSGHAGALYPWRQQVFARLAARYPCLTAPQIPYEDRAAGRLLVGADYARALNASQVVPSCGTMGHELVRKHLEVPGAGALLVTERSASLEAAGFVDGVNCIFATAEEAVDRVDAIFSDPAAMVAITRAGHDLVHARHTLQHRPQILDWYRLKRCLRPGQRIIQPGPFEPMAVAEVGSTRKSGHVACGGLDRALLTSAAAYLALGRIASARADYQQALAYVDYLPEARFGLALCDLEDGQPEAAAARLAALIEVTLEDYGAADPDPLEWAVYLAALVAGGRLDLAAELYRWFPGLAHPILAEMRRIIALLVPRLAEIASQGPARRSLHRGPAGDPAAFRLWVGRMAMAAGQPEVADSLGCANVMAAGRTVVVRPRLASYFALHRLVTWAGRDRGLVPVVPPIGQFGWLRHLRRRIGRAALASPAGPALAWLRRIRGKRLR